MFAAAACLAAPAIAGWRSRPGCSIKPRVPRGRWVLTLMSICAVLACWRGCCRRRRRLRPRSLRVVGAQSCDRGDAMARRPNTDQLDLFAHSHDPKAAGMLPPWQALPAEARLTLTSLMVRLILDHA